MRAPIATLFLAALVFATPGAGQEPDEGLSKDVERMVRQGMAEALESRLRGGRTAEEKHLLARAYANKARQVRQSGERKRAYERANEKYGKWIKVLEKAASRGDVTDVVRLAAGRVEYAGMMLSGQAASDLDEYEITAGRRGDRELLGRLLMAAREQYEKAASALTPLLDDLLACEEELLAAGVYDLLLQTRLDMTLNLGWANYYLGVLERKDPTRRRGLLAAAERRFQDLIDGGQVGQMRSQCYLAVGMAQREQGRLDEAEKSFDYALGKDVGPMIEARVRYELARSQIKSGKFDEARTTLRVLVEKDPANLSPGDCPARFYINLAHVWDANSYLVEAEVIRDEARGSAARTAILQKVQRRRETGLVKFRRLARRGGPWPALVQVYVASSVSVRTPPEELSVVELLYTAGVLIDAKRYRDARQRLLEAASREHADKNLAADVLFELGRCQYLLKDEQGAAAAFQKLAVEYRGHEKAARAATFAFELWGQIAGGTKAKEDYLQLAAVLRNLVESFADHPKRDEAAWLLPVALQMAGRFEEAADEFGKVPPASEHWEEAQYRRAMCRREVAEAARGSLSAGVYRAKAHTVVDALRRYADEARARAEAAINRGQVMTWSGQARLAAGELLASQGVDDYRRSLAVLESFESQYPESELLGRVLAVRIRAYRGLREFEQASKILAQFLEEARPEQVGRTLAALARGMQEEVERLLEDGQADAARELAKDSVQTFDELEKWLGADPSRGQSLDFVLAGRARMLYLAGQYQDAERIVATLLEKSPASGNYQHLQALVLTARLTDAAPPEELKKAQDVWAALLTDPAIRRRAPERYWEARYNWLALALRLGNAADVERAITQERVWRPDLGGTPWKEKLEGLLRDARVAQGKAPETQPAAETLQGSRR